jgi:hypothetical protein
MRMGNQDKNGVETRRRPCCRTGVCPSCIENARWERVFQEKFADPYYYSRGSLRSASPIAHLRPGEY